MADGSIRIETRLDNRKSKKDAKDFENIVDKATDSIQQSSEKSKLDIDISQAEKEINRLEKEIQKYEHMIEQLEGGKLGEYNAERKSLIQAGKADLANAKTPEQKANVRAMNASALEQLDKKYASVISKADQYGNIISRNDAKIDHLKNRIKQVDVSQKQVNNNARKHTSETKKSAAETKKTQSHANRLKTFLSSATKSAKSMAGALSGRALNAVKKLGSSIKTKIISNIKNATKHAGSMTKGFFKAGLVLGGVRGIIGGIRQLVSSALQNNEKMQNQLTAIKGVLGQALAPAISIVVNALGQAVSFADQLYQMLTGTSLVAKYNANQAKKQAEETAKAADSAKEYKNQLAGFDVANKLEDNSSSDKNQSSTNNSPEFFETQELSGWAQELIAKIKKSWETADFTDVGEMVSQKIVQAIKGVKWNDIQAKAFGAGKSFATLINGLLKYESKDGDTLAKSVGNTLAQAINTAISFLYGFTANLKWDKVGDNISDSFSEFVKNIDWKKALNTAGKAGSGITRLLKHLFTHKDKDGDTILSNATVGIANLVNAISTFVDNSIKELNKKNKSGQTGWQELGESISTALFKGLLAVDFKKVVDNIAGIVNGVKSMIQAMFDTLYEINPETGNTYGQDLWNDIGKHIVAGIIAGMIAALSLPFMKGTNASSGLGQIFTGVYKGLCEAFGIASPAKNMMPIGGYIIAGMFSGITNALTNIKEWLKTNVFDKITAAWQGMKELTLSIGGKIGDSFKKAKENWNSIKEKGKSAIATIKGKLGDKWKTTKDNWNNNMKKNKAVTKTIKGKLAKSFSNAKKNWNNIKDKAATVTASLKDKITSVIRSVLTGLCSMVNKVIRTLNKLPGINITEIQPPKLAKGGIVNNPGRGVHTIVGEKGPEAVIPLNDTVLGKIASMITANQSDKGKSVIIPVYLDGRMIAKYTVDTMARQSFELNKGGAY